MDPVSIGLAGCVLVVLLLSLGMPIAFLMMFVGFLGISVLSSTDAALGVLARTVYEIASNYSYTVIPLFVLMGGLANQAGITEELYKTFDKWFRGLPGGLGIATIAACAGFAAVCGSSVAATAAVGNIAVPEMKRFNYHPRLAGGIVVAGGTLSFLIPPSLAFVVYGMLTQQSIGKLLISGIFPGVLLSVAYIIAILVQVKVNPSLAPMLKSEAPFPEKLRAIKGVLDTIFVFLIVIGGIYFGFINPTEAGAVGVSALFILSVMKRRLTLKSLFYSLLEMARISSFVLFLVAGATVFSYFLALSTIPAKVSGWIVSLPIPRYSVLAMIIFIYLVLGCFLDAVSMMVLTLPVIFPVVISLGFDPIWFGVVAVLMMEAGLITPPVGLNVYTLAGILGDIPAMEIFKGAIPFLIAIFSVVLLITLFPQITLFLPGLMFRS
ncbi:MAG: TRAP transporter large permease [Deltaproteobacteria bacterium]|nr:TRAP transporter large permease [Deltaproteobacteria bacterium]